MKGLAAVALTIGISVAVWNPSQSLKAQPAPAQQDYQARVSKAKGDIQAIKAALLMFKFDNDMYPTNQMGLRALVVNPSDPRLHWRSGGYLKRLPKDPWGHDYQYRIPGAHGGDYDVYSFGDGGPNGSIYE